MEKKGNETNNDGQHTTQETQKSLNPKGNQNPKSKKNRQHNGQKVGLV